MMFIHGSTARAGSRLRRGAILVKTAILLPVIAGFAAVGVDLTMLQSVEADLQRAADAAALAAATRLATADPDANRHAVVLGAAQDVVDRNPVGSEYVQLVSEDLVLGQARFDSTEKRMNWVGPDEASPNAVQVTLRRTKSSPSGPVPLYFGRLIGRASANLQATARATLIPRDIVFVCDLSGSMDDDSELGHYKTAENNLHDVWLALGGGSGPTWGGMTTWGTDPITSSYQPSTDPGLISLPYGVSSVTAATPALTAMGYNKAEITALTSAAFDQSGNNWSNRVATTLGLANWKSGKPGARWTGGGNGDDKIDDAELSWIPYPYNGGGWADYIKNYSPNNTTDMYKANPAFRYAFGLKTFVNYLLERKPSHADTPILWQTPEQPLQAVKDAVTESVRYLAQIDSGDQLGLMVYATTAHHEVDLTRNLNLTSSTLIQRQANHYDGTTCIGCGMSMAVEELNSTRARPGASKVIVLLTDGIANVDSEGVFNEEAGRGFAVDATQAAADDGVLVYSVGVGAQADVDLLNQMAGIAHGTAFHAQGTVDQYTQQLHDIFQAIGGKRQPILIR